VSTFISNIVAKIVRIVLALAVTVGYVYLER
jgi:hypothetical protein